LLGGLATVLSFASVALSASPAVAANQQVSVIDTAFVAPAIAVKPGETVDWINSGAIEHHNVHFEDGVIFPGDPHAAESVPPWTRSRTFMTSPPEGFYRYYCDEHGGPGGLGMSGRVYVNATGTIPGTAPTASFTVPTGVAVGRSVVLDASGSTDPDPGDSIVRYEWDVNGDNLYESSAAQPQFTTMFPSAGVKVVNLRVTDGQGHTATTTRSVTVTNAPTASFTVAPGSVLTGQSVGFDASASADSDGTIARYEWDLDANGSFEIDTGTSPTTSRSYAGAATLTIALRVTDDLAAQTVTTRTLQVTAPAAPETPPAAATPPPPPAPAAAPCSTLKGAQRTSCLQKRCVTLKGAKRASCIASSCRYVTGAKRASCVQTSCRYVAANKRASCARASCRYLTGAKRKACERKYARKPTAT